MTDLQRPDYFSASRMAAVVPFFDAKYLDEELRRYELEQAQDVGRAVEKFVPACKSPPETTPNEDAESQAYFEVERSPGWNSDQNNNRISLEEAEIFLEDFIRKDWETNLSSGCIRIHCNLSLRELKQLGREERALGLEKCRKLFTAPVVHDAIVHALWEELSSEAITNGFVREVEKESLERKPEADPAVTKHRSISASPEPDTRKRKHSFMRPSRDERRRGRARSMTRRATEGDVPTKIKARSSSVTHFNRLERGRSSSASADKNATCGRCRNQAMSHTETVEEDPIEEETPDEHLAALVDAVGIVGAVESTRVAEATEYESTAEATKVAEDTKVAEATDVTWVREVVVRRTNTAKTGKRNSIKRKLSLRMSKGLTALGGGMASGYGGFASGYGGSRMIA